MTRRFLIRTFGCQMNEHDSERMAGLLAAEGMVPTESPDDADVVVFNTCCVRENADDRLYGQLGNLAPAKKARPEMQIAVGGCLAQKDKATVAKRAPHVDVVFGTHNLHRLPELLSDGQASPGQVIEVVDEPEVFASTLPAQRDVAFSAWVTIATGCDNSCTFCIVPSVRGGERSRRLGDVVAEVEALAADGVVEVTLLGQNVNSYGRDLNPDGRRPMFAELLRAMDAVPGLRRVRFTSPHPKDLRPETIAAMAECDAVCEQLHLPLQSGSDRVLAAMHRGYTAERFLGRLAAARDAVPGLAVTTDIIVGFPGETESDFAQTLEVVEAARFDSAFTFIYSPRPGTVAASLDDLASPEEKQERYQRLTSLVESIAWSRNLELVGQDVEILVEGPSKKDTSRLSGRTRGGKLVHVPDDGDTPAGAFRSARVLTAAPHYLAGELLPE